MEYCSKCGNVMNGFDYGYGVNSICESCNNKTKIDKLVIKKLELEIQNLKQINNECI